MVNEIKANADVVKDLKMQVKVLSEKLEEINVKGKIDKHDNGDEIVVVENFNNVEEDSNLKEKNDNA